MRQIEYGSIPSLIDFKNEVIEVNEEFASGYSAMLSRLGQNCVLGVGLNPITSWSKANTLPRLGSNVSLAQNVRIIGAVQLGANSSVGNSTSIRADKGKPIVIADGAKIGDQVTFHALKHRTIGIGQNLKTGTHVVFHGTLTVGNSVSVGDNAVVFNSTVGSNITIGKGALVIGVKLADGAVVPDGKVVTEQKDADALAPAGAPVTSVAALSEENPTLPTTGGSPNSERDVALVLMLLLIAIVMLLAGASLRRPRLRPVTARRSLGKIKNPFSRRERVFVSFHVFLEIF